MQVNKRRLLLFLPVVVAIGVGIFLYQGLSLNPRELPSALLGKPFPEFRQTSLKDPERVLTEVDLRGEIALVNVWATWCPSCKTEHPLLMAIARQGVPIYSLNYKDDRAAALQWLQNRGDPYRLNIFDPKGEVGFDLGVYGAPETYILDADGVIQYRYAGPISNQKWQEMSEVIKSLRASSG